MHKPVRTLCNFLQGITTLNLVGLEKSGAFVDHAHEICLNRSETPILNKGQYLILNNQYIYKYVIPGDPNRMHYGETSYYGGKVIFHSSDDQVFVVTVPIKDKNVVMEPQREDYQNLETILVNIQKLKCDMYDDAIIPVALANKLVSLANRPSKVLLEKFASKKTSRS